MIAEVGAFHPSIEGEKVKEAKDAAKVSEEVANNLTRQIEAKVPSEQELLTLVKSIPDAIQFKNSLVYIQGGTNVSLERMIARFDVLLAQVFNQGMVSGITLAKSLFVRQTSSNEEKLSGQNQEIGKETKT